MSIKQFTPGVKYGNKVSIDEIEELSSQGFPFVATGSIAFPPATGAATATADIIANSSVPSDKKIYITGAFMKGPDAVYATPGTFTQLEILDSV